MLFQTQHKTEQPSHPVYLKALRDVYDHYDLFIFDLWGVIHNGVDIFEGAYAVLNDLMHLKKPVYFLSNAPRRLDIAQQQLIDRGVPVHMYQGMLTSGQECLEHLRDRPDPFYRALGRHLYHIGPEKDLALIEGLDYTLTSLQKADFILNTGIAHIDNPAEVYRADLQIALERGLPMICANPDHTALVGDLKNPTSVMCAGYLAHIYAEMGGIVRYHGKPSAQMFHSLYARYNLCQQTPALMMGDSFRTDMCGVQNAMRAGFSIHSAFIKSGIHRVTSDHDMHALMMHYNIYPHYIIEAL